MARFRARVSACLLLSLVILDPATVGAQETLISDSPVTTRELVEIVGLSGLAISPDGNRAVIRLDQQSIADNRTKLEWVVIDLKDGRLNYLAEGGAPRWDVNGGLAIEQPQWSSDGGWIYFRRLEGEEAQLWRAYRDGSQLQQVTHDTADVSAFIIDNQAVHYAVGPATRDQIKAAEQLEYENGVLLDNSYILGYRPTHNFMVNGRMATYRRSPEAQNFGEATLLGETPLIAKTLSPESSETVAADAAIAERFNTLWRESAGGSSPFDPLLQQRHTSTTKLRAEVDPLSSWTHMRINFRPRSGKVLSSKNLSGKASLCRASACLDADRISVIGWTTDGKLIFKTETFGTTALNKWDTAKTGVQTLLRTEAVLGSAASGLLGECSIAVAEAICISASADQPPRLIAINLENGAVRTLLDPNPTLSASRLGIASRIMITDRFGSSTFGRLVLPRNRDPSIRLPLVITSYTCGGFLLGGSGRDVPEHVLAAQGFAVVCVDSSGGAVRRAPGFVVTLESDQLSGLDFFEGAVRVLDEKRIIDPKRVMLTGYSGSTTNTTSAISRSRMFTAAAVTTGGSPDVILCYLAPQYRACADVAKAEKHDLPYDSRTGLLANSPAWNAHKIETPLLMQLPETEYPEMMQLYGSMVDYGRAVEMHIFADAYHHKSQPRQRLSVYNRNIDWANFWLRGISSVDPLRRDQNERWSALREAQCKLFVGDTAVVDLPSYCAPAARGD